MKKQKKERKDLENKVANIKNTIEAIKLVLQQHATDLLSYTVVLKEMKKTGILISIEYLTPTIPIVQFDSLKEIIHLQIKELLEKNKIDLACIADNVI